MNCWCWGEQRRDIEPCLDYFFGLERINPELTFAQHIFINGFELITYCGCQRALEHIVLVCGAHGLGADHYPILNPLNSARFAFYSGLLRAPLVDAAETVSGKGKGTGSHHSPAGEI